MALSAVQINDVSDDAQNRNNRSLQQFTDQMGKVPFLDGVFLRKQALKSGLNTLNHGLGRAYVSYFLGRVTAAAVIFDATASVDPAKQIQLNSSVDCVIDIWVF